MNRADRIRRVVPGAAAGLVAELATLPAAEVDLIVAALRQARRDALQQEANRKRQRKADDRKHGNVDESELTGRNLRMLRSQGARAVTSLDALSGLVEARQTIDDRIDTAARQLRAEYSDVEIARVIGVTSAAVGQRYGTRTSRRDPATAASPDSSDLETGIAAGQRRAQQGIPNYNPRPGGGQ